MPPFFSSGSLVYIIDDDGYCSEIFVVLREYFDEKLMSHRVEVIDGRGKLSSYPPMWFTEIDMQ